MLSKDYLLLIIVPIIVLIVFSHFKIMMKIVFCFLGDDKIGEFVSCS